MSSAHDVHGGRHSDQFVVVMQRAACILLMLILSKQSYDQSRYDHHLADDDHKTNTLLIMNYIPD